MFLQFDKRPTANAVTVRRGNLRAAWPRLASVILLCAAALPGCGTPFSARETINLSAPGPAHKLVIDNHVGTIDLRADPAAAEVRAEVIRIGRGATQAEADAALQAIEVSLAAEDGEPGTIVALARFPRSCGLRGYEARWRIVAPADAIIDATNGVGAVCVTGFHNQMMIKTDVGDIAVSCDRDRAAEAGPVKLTTGVGDIRAENVGADLSAITGVGHIRASAGGKISLRTDVGNASLRLLSHNPDAVLVKTDVGDISIRVPDCRTGKLVADSGVGILTVQLGPVVLHNLRNRSHHFDAELGHPAATAPAADPDKPVPAIDLTTDVGDVIVRGYDAE